MVRGVKQKPFRALIILFKIRWPLREDAHPLMEDGSDFSGMAFIEFPSILSDFSEIEDRCGWAINF